MTKHKNKKQKNNRKQSKNKKKYKVRNWKEYNQMLVNRGRIDMWVDKGILERWFAKPQKIKGAPKKYTNEAIELTLQLGTVFSMRLRQTEGFVHSIFQTMKVNLTVPDHSTLSRRGEILPIKLPKENKENLTIILDGSGLKVYGEGEWKVRKHGYSKHRTWMKVGLAITPDNEIRAVSLTDNTITDGESAKALLLQEEASIEKFVGDGAYDKRNVYQLGKARNIKQMIVPPQKNAKIWQHGNCKLPPLARDENLRQIRKETRKKWKERTGYHVRSLVETAFFRFKTIFGDKLKARNFPQQMTEVSIKASILNKMRILGMPESYAVN